MCDRRILPKILHRGTELKGAEKRREKERGEDDDGQPRNRIILAARYFFFTPPPLLPEKREKVCRCAECRKRRVRDLISGANPVTESEECEGEEGSTKERSEAQQTQQTNLEHHPKVPIDPARTHQEKPKRTRRMNARVTVASRSRVAAVCGANLKVRCARQTVRGARFEGFKAHAASGNQPNIADSVSATREISPTPLASRAPARDDDDDEN